jgi:hypothetical protein
MYFWRELENDVEMDFVCANGFESVLVIGSQWVFCVLTSLCVVIGS